jgi:hypothetical protein
MNASTFSLCTVLSILVTLLYAHQKYESDNLHLPY